MTHRRQLQLTTKSRKRMTSASPKWTVMEAGQGALTRVLSGFGSLPTKFSPQSYLTGWDCQPQSEIQVKYAPLPSKEPADLMSLIQQTRKEVSDIVTAFKYVAYLGTRFAIKSALLIHLVNNTAFAKVFKKMAYNGLVVFSTWSQEVLIVLWAMSEAYEQALKQQPTMHGLKSTSSSSSPLRRRVSPVQIVEVDEDPVDQGSYFSNAIEYISGSIWSEKVPKEEEKVIIEEPIKPVQQLSSYEILSLLPSRLLHVALTTVRRLLPISLDNKEGISIEEVEEDEEEENSVEEEEVTKGTLGHLKDNWTLFVPPIAVIVMNAVWERLNQSQTSKTVVSQENGRKRMKKH